MKRIVIAVVCAVILLPITIYAQKPHSDLKNEIGVTAGPISFMGGVFYGTIGFWSALGSSLSHSAVDMDLYGQYGLHYYYQVKPWCQVGAKFSFEGAKLTYYTDTTKLTIKSQEKMALISFMPSVRFTYLNRPWVRLYSGADIGFCYLWNDQNSKESEATDSKDNNFLFAFNVTAFGVNVGKKFFGMLELNFGYDSYIKAGIGARF